MKRPRLLCLAFSVSIASALSAGTAAAQDGALPADSLDLLGKLQQFEKKELAQATEVIAEKRAAVAEALQQHLKRETKAGRLDTALQLRTLIETLGKPQPETAGVPAEFDFVTWVATVELHEDEGWWEVTGDELIQHLEGGEIKRFPCQVDDRKLEVTFALSGNPYRFQFLPDRSKGIRSRSDDSRRRLFTVKPKR